MHNKSPRLCTECNALLSRPSILLGGNHVVCRSSHVIYDPADRRRVVCHRCAEEWRRQTKERLREQRRAQEERWRAELAAIIAERRTRKRAVPRSSKASKNQWTTAQPRNPDKLFYRGQGFPSKAALGGTLPKKGITGRHASTILHGIGSDDITDFVDRYCTAFDLPLRSPNGSSDGPRRELPKGKINAAREALRDIVQAGKPINRQEWDKKLGVSMGTIQRAELQERGYLEGLREAKAAPPVAVEQDIPAAVAPTPTVTPTAPMPQRRMIIKTSRQTDRLIVQAMHELS